MAGTRLLIVAVGAFAVLSEQTAAFSGLPQYHGIGPSVASSCSSQVPALAPRPLPLRQSRCRGNVFTMQAAGPDALLKELKLKLKSSNVWLVGMDGCQKDKVGDFLARKLGYRFIDTNAILEQLAKVPIDSAMTALGEQQFVQVERAVLDQVQAFVRSVISTGSCAPLEPENWAKFRTGLVVYMDCSAAALSTGGLQSPLASEAAALLDLPDKDRLELLLAQRSAMYSQADVTVPVPAGRTVEELAGDVAKAIIDHISENPAPETPTLGEAHAKALSRELGLVPPPPTDDSDRTPAAAPKEQLDLLNRMMEGGTPPPPKE